MERKAKIEVAKDFPEDIKGSIIKGLYRIGCNQARIIKEMSRTEEEEEDDGADNCIFGNQIRFTIMIISTLCLSSILSNILTFNFTFICMAGDRPDNFTAMSDVELQATGYNPGLDYTSAQRSALFMAVAVGALLAVFPLTIALNKFGSRLVFGILGYISACSTYLIPVSANLGFPCILLMRVIQGVGFSACLPVMGSITSHWSTLKQNGIFIAILSSFLQLLKFAMEIEVGQANGVFLKAKVQEVSKDGIKVEYLSSWSQPEVAKFNRCRILNPNKSPAKSPSSQFKVGDIVEAYIKQPDSEIHAWQKAKIREIKGGFAVLGCIEGPANSEIVSLENCRHFGQTIPISFELFNTFTIVVPNELTGFFGDSTAFDPLHEYIEGINIEYVKADRKIFVTSFSPHAIRCVEVVSESFLNNCKQKKQFTDQLRDSKTQASPYDGKFVEEFSVPDDLVGLAIGKKGANITDARKISGVLDIIVDKSRREKAGICVFKVIAETAEAASEARQMLEYVYASVPVPKDLVGQVVGKLGKNMQEIVNQSGAVKVQIGQGGDEDREIQSGEVDFIFTGTRESFKLAKLMIQFQLKHILEMDALRAEIDDAAKNIPDTIPPNFRSTGRRQLVPKNFDKK